MERCEHGVPKDRDHHCEACCPSCQRDIAEMMEQFREQETAAVSEEKIIETLNALDRIEAIDGVGEYTRRVRSCMQEVLRWRRGSVRA